MRWTFVWTGMAVGCGVQVGGEGDPYDPCLEPTETEIGYGEGVADGHSVEEALAMMGAESVHQPSWFDGRPAAITVTASAIGDVAKLLFHPDHPYCGERLLFPVAFSVTSDDGALEEEWEDELEYREPWTSIDSYLRIPVEERGGTLDPNSIMQSAEYISVGLEFDESGSAGTVRLDLTTVDGPGPDEPGGVLTDVCTWDDRI